MATVVANVAGPPQIPSGSTIDSPTFTGTINGITTAGQRLAPIVARGRSTAQTAAVASVCAVTAGAADTTYLVSGNLLITSSTTFSIFITVGWTDEGNTSRSMNLVLSSLSGATSNSAGNAGGAIPYSASPQVIRAKAGTTVTVATAGTFTSVTYNVEVTIEQIATT